MLKIIYPNSPDIHNQSSAGNVGEHMVAMTALEWAAFLQLKNIPID